MDIITTKEDLVKWGIVGLKNPIYDVPEIRTELREAILGLISFLEDMEDDTRARAAIDALDKLTAKLISIGAIGMPEYVDSLVHTIFLDHRGLDWPDNEGTIKANGTCLAKKVKSDLNHGEAPTVILSRHEVNVLCVALRGQKPKVPDYYHVPITGKAVIEVVGVRMGDLRIVLETRVIFKGKRCKLQGVRTGLNGTVHGLLIEAPYTYAGQYAAWDLYIDVPTRNGKKHGIDPVPEPWKVGTFMNWREKI